MFMNIHSFMWHTATFAILSAYYLGKTAQLDPERIAARLQEMGADQERIEAVLRSISAEA